MYKRFLLFVFSLASISGFSQTTYYFQGGILSDVANWNTINVGGGSTPPDFDNANDIWNLNDKTTATCFTWDLAGHLMGGSTTLTQISSTGIIKLKGDVTTNGNITINDFAIEYTYTADPVDIIPGNHDFLILNTNVQGTSTGNISTTTDLNIYTGAVLDMATYTLSTDSNTNGANPSASGTIKTQNTSSTPLTLSSGNWLATIEYNAVGNQTVVAGEYEGGLIIGSGGVKSANGDLTVHFSLSLNGILDMVTHQLLDGSSAFTLSGSSALRTQSTNNPPIPSGKTWSTVVFNGTSGTQYIPEGTYAVLGETGNPQLISHEATGDITITGQLFDLGVNLDMKTFRILSDGDGFTTSALGTYTISTQNLSIAPFPSDITWNAGATINFNSSAGDQYIPQGTYYNLQCKSDSSSIQRHKKITRGNITVSNGLHILDSDTYLVLHHLLSGNFTTNSSGTYGYLEIDVSSPASAFPSGKTWYNHVFINQASYSIPSLTMVDNDLYVDQNASLGGNLTLSGSGVVFIGDNSNARTLTCGTNTIAFNGSGCRVESIASGCEVNTTATTPFSGTVEFTDGVVVDFASTSAQNVPGGTYRGGITISNGTSYSNRKSATGALSMGNALTIETNNYFHAESNAISEYDSGSIPLTISGDGYFYTAHLGGDPVPADKDWSSLTQFRYENNAERVMGGTYSRLALSGIGNNHITQGNVTCTEFFTINEDLEVAPGTYITGTTLDRSSNGSGEVILQASASGYGQAHFTAKSGTQVMTKQYYLDVSSARWFHLSTTFPGADFQDLNDGNILVSASNNTGTVWKWNSDIAEWEAGDLTSNDPAAGQTVFAGTTSDGTFLLGSSGTVDLTASDINVADQTIALNYDDGSSSNATFTTGDKTGWNFIANPFTANYDWDNATKPASNFSTAYYVWNGTNYLSRNAGTGTAGQYIAPGQAFFVQTQSGWSDGTNLTFAIASVDVTGSGSFNKANSLKDEVLLTFSENNGTYQDQLIVKFEGTSTPQFDGNWDAHKLINGPGVPNAWVKLNNAELSLCTTPATITDFPISFKDDDANQMITVTLNDDDLTSFNKAVLEDLKTGTFTEISNGGTYTFVNDKSYSVDRFILHFTESTIGIEEENELATSFEAYISNNTLHILNHSNSGAPLKGQLIDLSGRVIHSFVEDSGEFIEIPLPRLTGGVYLLSITQNSKQIGAQKLIIQ